nr:WYL domain-containing protein [uncultured Pseudogulbenkiania sp.]
MSERRDIQLERLFYLEFLALFTGRVSRKDLVQRFGISEPAATKDLSIYANLAPNVLRYDLRQKCYVLENVEPYFSHDVDQALYSLAGERALAINPGHAKRLPSWVNSNIKRNLSLPLVAAITRCMYQGCTMAALYASLSSGFKERVLSPLALVHDGLRWHIRCFDHSRNEFRDYNLGRFNEVQQGATSGIRLEDDREWMTEVSLKLVPHPKASHPDTIRMDYDITEEAKTVSLRACLVGYFLRHWHIDYSEEGTGNPKAQQLFLSNKSELLEHGVPRWAFES